MRRLAAAVAVLALAALAVAGAMTMDLGAAATALEGADPELLAAAVALYVVGQTSRAACGRCARPPAACAGCRSAPRSACTGWPARPAAAAGQPRRGARVGLVRRHPAGAGAGGLRITGGLVGYKAVDAVVTGLAVLAMALVVPLPGPAAGLRWTAAGAVAVVLAVAVAWRLGALRPLLALLPGRAHAALGRLGEGAAVLGSPQVARTAAVLGLGAIVARLLSLAALLAALGAPPQAAALAFCVIVLAGIVPAAPGGAGTRELVLVPALALAYGMPGDEALAFSIAVQGTALVASLTVGAAALAWPPPAWPAAGRSRPATRRPRPRRSAPPPSGRRPRGAGPPHQAGHMHAVSAEPRSRCVAVPDSAPAGRPDTRWERLPSRGPRMAPR